ncbi:MAG TPA: hypothetical protein VGX78_11610, partial [Pirellulales bacterium]|nr:hypothetical protein [Pirellulales bacterium]
YEEFVDFIAAGTTSKDIVAFRPSEAANSQVADLIQRQKSVGLTADEAAELNYYLQIEHLMRLAKARARKHLAESS